MGTTIATLPSTVAAAVRAGAEHRLRPVPQAGSNLSDFECGCGQQFVANALVRTPRGLPSLPAVHTAEALALAVGGGQLGTEMVDRHQVTALLPDWTVVRDAAGTMARRVPGFSRVRWLTQAGSLLETGDLALPLSVLHRQDPAVSYGPA
ncbi:hypothetical protein CHO01_17190 [Cellulomonas hominis]|uniref:Uncharacterized protein n=1 Tax=Cellulomonas hominis TaxID=156981 RepID=A0A511FBN5_9CELL|nr:hypothetical protein [Cellulomonas hominis]MBB5474565.1 hypothetical protein [Cellulomonas hominis]NKY05597.1 hypothetical protein [Cellulomonas hominis]GEL46603.1 hypothetical protein CHO01_17190 [Cellulomonas hominis]